MSRPQSYALALGLACATLAMFVTVMLVYDGCASENPLPLPQMEPVRTPLMARIGSTRVALVSLQARSRLRDVAQQLPLPPPPAPVVALPATVGVPVPQAPSGFVLTTIVEAGGQRSAIVNGRVAHVGDRLDGSSTVLSIESGSVHIRRGAATLVVTMKAGPDEDLATGGTGK